MNPSVRHDDQHFLSLLEKWQNGDFTRADEQALQMLTASDDFRREALEGFMSLPETEHESRLNALRMRLYERAGAGVGGGRRIALPQIWAAAAALVLLLAAIWFFPNWNEKNTAPIAQTQNESAQPVTPPAPSSAPETYYDEQIDAQQSTPETTPSPTAKHNAAAPGGQTYSGPAAGAGASDVAALEEKSADLKDDAPANTLAAAPLRDAPAEDAAFSKAMPAAESKKEYAAAKPASPPPAKSVAKAKKHAKPADSVWHETDRKPDMEAERQKVRDETQQESQPANGWDTFREFLRQNARLSPEARNRNVSGTVRLQFNINENGEPQTFVVLRSVGYGCDQEAIRLVQSWEWVRGKNPIVTLDIPFVQ